MATTFTRTASVGNRGREGTVNAPVRVEEGRTKAGHRLRGSRDAPAGLWGRGPVRSSGHKPSFVHSMSPEMTGTVDSTMCALRLNKAGREAGGEGEGAARKRKLG